MTSTASFPPDSSFLEGRSLLVTGGTGSFGKRLVRTILAHHHPRRLIVYSRDELKQFDMQQEFPVLNHPAMRYFLGDVRDHDRLRRALDGVDYVVHAAAMKQVPACEYNPIEAIKTNILGAANLIEASLDAGVQRLVALSTDKAANPINLYGATKLCSDKLFLTARQWGGGRKTRFCVVRYGNVVGSRGSVIPYFLHRMSEGVLPITDYRMTRFWITLQQGVNFVLDRLMDMHGGELFVPRIPSMRITDLARVLAPQARQVTVGIRPGEKLHELMISENDARNTLDLGTHFIVLPEESRESTRRLPIGKTVPDGFQYDSETNDQWVDDETMKRMIADLELPEARKWAAEQGL